VRLLSDLIYGKKMFIREKRYAGFKELRSKEERMKGIDRQPWDPVPSDFSYITD